MNGIICEVPDEVVLGIDANCCISNIASNFGSVTRALQPYTCAGSLECFPNYSCCPSAPMSHCNGMRNCTTMPFKSGLDSCRRPKFSYVPQCNYGPRPLLRRPSSLKFNGLAECQTVNTMSYMPPTPYTCYPMNGRNRANF
ncbi:uncharacterized protein LOC119686111 [Teleopsis dalmanni]|uniref:uncharacterized protein LOC119686111 n=1 Tax=Teleopsis dalmanni TaxID=139649 RepID=UPI000D329E3B|nr:uncharacterized protein LOC119686111 [Teleopsis dalmanni]